MSRDAEYEELMRQGWEARRVLNHPGAQNEATEEDVRDLAVYLLKEMRRAARAFYADAFRIGHHQFLEHAGLLNKHVEMLQQVHDAGGSIWSDTPPLPNHAARYLGEKVNCIHGEAFARNPKAFEAFVNAAKGEK